MFRGNHLARVDEKGRLKLPADFKRRVDDAYGSRSFYITSRTGERAQLYPVREWEEIERKLASIPNSNEVKRKFIDATNYYGQMVEMDDQGRLMLPPVLREKANVLGDVVVLGSQTFLEVANRGDFVGHIEAHPITAADDAVLESFGI